MNVNELGDAPSFGSLDDFPELPREVTIDGAPYWLVRTSDQDFLLLLNVCPHAGGEIRHAGDVLICPLHFWTFDPADGACLNFPGERLMRREVVVRDRRLFVAGPLR